MKKLATYTVLITFVILLSANIAFAENEVPETPVIDTPSSIEAPSIVNTRNIIDDPLYLELQSMINDKNSLILEENQVCKDIKNQEKSNADLASKIIEKTKSYSAPYRKIIDDIKLLLNPIKKQRNLDYVELTKNNTNTTSTTSTSNASDASSTTDTIDTLNKKIKLYDKQISNLNLAIKEIRESIKYISLESVAYNQKLESVQQQIDTINLSIVSLNKEIIEDKIKKDTEWKNFCSAMNNGDLKTSKELYNNIIEIKRRIVNNYKEILKHKKSIEEQLLSLQSN